MARQGSSIARKSTLLLFERAARSFPPVTKSDSQVSVPFQNKMANAVSWEEASRNIFLRRLCAEEGNDRKLDVQLGATTESSVQRRGKRKESIFLPFPLLPGLDKINVAKCQPLLNICRRNGIE